MYFIFLLSLRPPQRRSFPGLRPDGSRLAFLESPAPSRQQGAPRLSVSALPKRGPRATGRWRARRWRTPPAQLGIRQAQLARAGRAGHGGADPAPPASRCHPGLAPLSALAVTVAAAPLVRPSSVATALSRLWKHDSFSHLLELKDANARCCPH